MKRITLILLATVLAFSFALASCSEEKKADTQTTTEPAQQANNSEAGSTSEVNAAPSPEDTAGFTEIPLGDEFDKGPLHIAGVYFQPVDMEPAGNSLAKKDADCHMEADIAANEEGVKLGFGKEEFVPYLQVKCLLQKKDSDKVQEIAFMPMNASDGPHYGANVKFEEGLGQYHVKFIISPPGNDYLLHVDKETGVEGRFWTEPIEVEWDVEWAGAQW